MRLLLVEDDAPLATAMVRALKREGFAVSHVVDGKQAVLFCKTDHPDIMILDLGLPDIDGLDVLKQIRRFDIKIQVLILTARDALDEKVAGLDKGADDYLTKPFELDELLARLRVLERRLGSAHSSEIQIGSIMLDTSEHKVNLCGNLLTLSKREYTLLKTLMESAGIIQTRAKLEARLYSEGEEVASNVIEVHIHNLRKKLVPGFIKTVRDVGYLIHKP